MGKVALTPLSHHHNRGIGMTADGRRTRLLDELRGMGIRDEKVLKAIGKVLRHEFIGEALKSRAYDNDALPIGQGQTISQPYIVAKMTQAIFENGAKPKKVLEIGTGCGYQTAVLAEVVTHVFTVERLKHLSEQARACLAKLDYHNVFFSYGDGHLGWTTYAPFDAILVTAAGIAVPKALTDQLAVGGRLLIPVGAQGAEQKLKLIERTATGLKTRELESVSFVPLLAGKA